MTRLAKTHHGLSWQAFYKIIPYWLFSIADPKAAFARLYQSLSIIASHRDGSIVTTLLALSSIKFTSANQVKLMVSHKVNEVVPTKKVDEVNKGEFLRLTLV